MRLVLVADLLLAVQAACASAALALGMRRTRFAIERYAIARR
jgi:hypothetical protein